MRKDTEIKEKQAITKNLANWMKKRRLELELTQEQVAYKSGLSLKHIERLENGRYSEKGLDIRLLTVKKISKVLNIQICDLVTLLLK